MSVLLQVRLVCLILRLLGPDFDFHDKENVNSQLNTASNDTTLDQTSQLEASRLQEMQETALSYSGATSKRKIIDFSMKRATPALSNQSSVMRLALVEGEGESWRSKGRASHKSTSTLTASLANNRTQNSNRALSSNRSQSRRTQAREQLSGEKKAGPSSSKRSYHPRTPSSIRDLTPSLKSSARAEPKSTGRSGPSAASSPSRYMQNQMKRPAYGLQSAVRLVSPEQPSEFEAVPQRSSSKNISVLNPSNSLISDELDNTNTLEVQQDDMSFSGERDACTEEGGAYFHPQTLEVQPQVSDSTDQPTAEFKPNQQSLDEVEERLDQATEGLTIKTFLVSTTSTTAC